MSWFICIVLWDDDLSLHWRGGMILLPGKIPISKWLFDKYSKSRFSSSSCSLCIWSRKKKLAFFLLILRSFLPFKKRTKTGSSFKSSFSASSNDGDGDERKTGDVLSLHWRGGMTLLRRKIPVLVSLSSLWSLTPRRRLEFFAFFFLFLRFLHSWGMSTEAESSLESSISACTNNGDDRKDGGNENVTPRFGFHTLIRMVRPFVFSTA